MDLLDEVVRVLKPGGMAVFETPNPENIHVSTHSFYLDPTHVRPLPSLLMRFLLEARGLCEVEVMYLNPWPEEHAIRNPERDVEHRFNYLFYGPQDYAVLGTKPAGF
jgi:O-antigen chain-terminating methyltransferase